MTNAKLQWALVVAVALTSSACASSSQKSSGGGGGSDSETYWVYVRSHTIPVAKVINAPVEQVQQAVPGVFKQFGYPGGYLKGNSWGYATTMLEVTGRLYEGEPNSDYFDCGQTPGGGIAANEYAITFAMLARVLPAPAGGSQLEIVIDGTARARGQTSNSINCRGTGRLENAVIEAVRQKAGNG